MLNNLASISRKHYLELLGTWTSTFAPPFSQSPEAGALPQCPLSHQPHAPGMPKVSKWSHRSVNICEKRWIAWILSKLTSASVFSTGTGLFSSMLVSWTCLWNKSLLTLLTANPPDDICRLQKPEYLDGEGEYADRGSVGGLGNSWVRATQCVHQWETSSHSVSQ